MAAVSFLLSLLIVTYLPSGYCLVQMVSKKPHLLLTARTSIRQFISCTSSCLMGTNPRKVTSRLFGGGQVRDGIGKAKGYSDLSSRYILETHTLSGLPATGKPFLVLGIESSCDDTGAAIVRSDGVVLSNVVYSQYEIHEKFGGIVPGLAMEAHKGNIEKAVAEAVRQAGLTSVQEVDAIAVTRGPGLEICLRVGYQKAQALAKDFNKPFVTVHHLEAHCMIARLAGRDAHTNSAIQPHNTVTSPVDTTTSDTSTTIATEDVDAFIPKVEYPFLALLASGGHTSILLCREMGGYEVLGGTLDDALGEAFDKAARLLGLKCSSSGGAAVEAAAARGDVTAFPMTVPMRQKVNCDFSYAGLKNQFRLAVQTARAREGLDIDSTNAPLNQMEEAPELVTLSDAATADLCASFQSVAFQHVEDRLKRALDYLDNNSVEVTALVVVGGVAANKDLKRRLLDLVNTRASLGRWPPIIDHPYHDHCPVTLERIESEETRTKRALRLVFPPPHLCTDNGLMVAWAGVEKLMMGISDNIDGQEVIARWPLGSPIANGSPVFRKRDLR